MSDIMERRMDAYYYAFEKTGVDAIDKILSAVACAGKAYHHTDCWNDEAGPYGDHKGNTPVDWIQNAGAEAAAEIERLREALGDILRDLREQRDTGLCARSRDEQISAIRVALEAAKKEGK